MRGNFWSEISYPGYKWILRLQVFIAAYFPGFQRSLTELQKVM